MGILIMVVKLIGYDLTNCLDNSKGYNGKLLGSNQ